MPTPLVNPKGSAFRFGTLTMDAVWNLVNRAQIRIHERN
jgi:hypothetical protein